MKFDCDAPVLIAPSEGGCELRPNHSGTMPRVGGNLVGGQVCDSLF